MIKKLKNSLRRYFFRDKPLSASLGLIEEEESVIQFENICIDLLHFGVSFMAVSAETGDIIGAMLNSTVCRGDKIKHYCDKNNNKSLKYNKIMIILEKDERDIDFFGQYPNIERIMKLEIITVNKAYRGQGICKALVKKSKYIKHNLFISLSIIEICRTVATT
uniref:N-acetyltransferase domain-containing protein n=1 Tax=Schizaphis graminum TaxID=13262 RepID=A0A2S2PHN2_SCHGA